MLFHEEETGLHEEYMLTASEVRVKVESIAGKWVRLEDLRDWNGRSMRSGGRK